MKKLLFCFCLTIVLSGYPVQSQDAIGQSHTEYGELPELPSPIDRELLDSMTRLPVSLSRVTMEDPDLARFSYERLRNARATNLRLEMSAVPESLIEHSIVVFENRRGGLRRLSGYTMAGVSSAMRNDDRLLLFFGLNRNIDAMTGGLFFLIDENRSRTYDVGESFAFLESDRKGELIEGVQVIFYVPSETGTIQVSDIPVPALSEEEQDRLAREHDPRLIGAWFRVGWESSSHRFYPSFTTWYSYVDENGTSRFVDGTYRSESYAYLRTGAYYFEGDILFIDYDDDDGGFLPHKR